GARPRAPRARGVGHAKAARGAPLVRAGLARAGRARPWLARAGPARACGGLRAVAERRGLARSPVEGRALVGVEGARYPRAHAPAPSLAARFARPPRLALRA